MERHTDVDKGHGRVEDATAGLECSPLVLIHRPALDLRLRKG